MVRSLLPGCLRMVHRIAPPGLGLRDILPFPTPFPNLDDVVSMLTDVVVGQYFNRNNLDI